MTNPETPAHWILDNPAVLGGTVAGLRAPDVVRGLIIEGLSSEDGRTFEAPPFAAGRLDAVLVVLDAPTGETVFQALAGYVAGRVSLKENLADDNEVVVALWRLPAEEGEGSAVLLVGDTSGNMHAQEALDRTMALHKLHLQRSEKMVMGQNFDAARIVATGEGVFDPAVGAIMQDLLAASPKPSAVRRKPA